MTRGGRLPKPPSASGASSCRMPSMFPARRRCQHVGPNGSKSHTEVRTRFPPYIYSPYGGHHLPGHTTRREPHCNWHHHHPSPAPPPHRRLTRSAKEPGEDHVHHVKLIEELRLESRLREHVGGRTQLKRLAFERLQTHTDRSSSQKIAARAILILAYPTILRLNARLSSGTTVMDNNSIMHR